MTALSIHIVAAGYCRGPIIDAITLCIAIRHNCQTHRHPLNAANNMLYSIGPALINFGINKCVMGRVLRCLGSSANDSNIAMDSGSSYA